MNVETAYPVFEASQVLTSTQLNDLAEYLEQQDRISRRALSGIGVLCGFDVDAAGGQIAISKGVAVTSSGFLICDDAQTYDRFRPYEVPVPTAEEADAAEIAEARYPFLFPDGTNQIDAFELLDTDFAPALGEAAPQSLTAAFMADKTVMLFLECRLESLRNCDINDCSDKGAERRFTLRRLLVTRTQANAMIAQEEAIAGRPVDLNTHPRNDLPFIRVEKLALARTGTSTYADLLFRIVSIALKLSTGLPQALRDAHAAYNHLLDDLYPPGEDPFPATYFSNLWGQLILNIFMAQYFYDYMRDVAMAYNEFVQKAACFEAECLPNPDRFPKHVLLGDAVAAPDAFTTSFPTPASVLAHNHIAATTGAGLPARPAERRTHFVHSPATQNQPRLDEVRALFRRMHLLALTYRTQGLTAAPIRLTPSRTGAAPLSERAIPFYYAFQQTSDLFTDWSPQKTKTRLLSTVYSYQFSAPDDAHPLHFRLDDQDFIRVEGIVGKPLGSAMAELIAYKRDLGLSFSIEPVFMPLAADANDAAGAALDRESAQTALAAARKLLLCRLSDLDFIFLIVIGAIIAFLVFLVQRIGQLIPSQGGQLTPGLATTGNFAFATAETGRPAAAIDDLAATSAAGRAGSIFNLATAERFRVVLPPEEEVRLKLTTENLRTDLKAGTFTRTDIVTRLTPDAPDNSIAAIFAAVDDEAAGGNLFDRTQAFVQQNGGDETAVQTTYAPIAMMAQSTQLINALNVDSISDFDEDRFDVAYRGFADSYDNYARVVETNAPQDNIAAAEQVQIAAAAGNVASQTTAFAAANIRSELGAVLLRMFESLTLAGYAKRHPGLEHHAGVSDNGTLVLLYASSEDLPRQITSITSRLSGPVGGLNNILAPNSAAAEPAGIDSLAAAVVDRTDDVLDRFIVVGDLALPYQCCDADCSDVVLSDRITADPFGRNVDPGPMAVTPLDPATVPRRPIGNLTGGSDLIGRDTLPGRVRPSIINRDFSRGIVTPFERFVPTQPVIPTQPVNPIDIAVPRQPTGPVTPGIATVTLSGRVGITRRNGFAVLEDSSVVVTGADGRETRTRTDRGTFKIAVPPGPLRIRGVSPGHRGTGQTIDLQAGQDRELTLLVTRIG